MKELNPAQILNAVARGRFSRPSVNDRAYIPDISDDALIAYFEDEGIAVVVDGDTVSVVESDDEGTTSWGTMISGHRREN